MKGFVAGLIVGVGVGGGALFAALPNPAVGECVIADVVVPRSEPTFIDPDGEVLGLRIWQACGYQVPTGVGSQVRAVDDNFWTNVDLDDVDPEDAEVVAAILAGD